MVLYPAKKVKINITCHVSVSCLSTRIIRESKDPLYTKLTVMNCTISNSNLRASSSSGLRYDCFYIKLRPVPILCLRPVLELQKGAKLARFLHWVYKNIYFIK